MTVCKEVVDIKIIKDCTDTVSTTCTQQSVQQSHSSAVVGADTRVGPEAVVATHGTVAVGAVAAPAVAVAAAPVVAGGVVAAYGGAAAPLVAGYAGVVLLRILLHSTNINFILGIQAVHLFEDTGHVANLGLLLLEHVLDLLLESVIKSKSITCSLPL